MNINATICLRMSIFVMAPESTEIVDICSGLELYIYMTSNRNNSEKVWNLIVRFRI